MHDFFQGQMDYIFFVYGFSFLLLFMTALALAHTQAPGRPWRWLAWFGLLHGLHEWLHMVALAWHDDKAFLVPRIAMLAGSYFLLLEFGRAGGLRRNDKAVGRWIFLPLAGIALCGLFSGPASFDAAGRYALGLTGGLWSAWSLWRLSRQEIRGRRALRLATATLGLYALSTGLIVPRCSFFPASLVNQEAFFTFTGCPVQLVRGALALLFAFALWCYKCRQSEDCALNTKRHHDLFEWATGALLIVSLAIGWRGTNQRGQRVMQESREDLIQRSNIAAAAVDSQKIEALAGSTLDLGSPDYQRLKAQMTAIRSNGRDVRFCYLMRMRDKQIIFLMDSEPQTSKDYSPPGQVYEEATPLLRGVFASAMPSFEGPTVDRWGTWISAFSPVFDDGGKVIAVLGMDIDFTHWLKLLAHERLHPILITMHICILLLFSLYAQNRHWRMENDLLSTLALLNAVLASTANGILAVNRKGRWLRYNHRFTDIWRLSEETMESKDNDAVLGQILFQLRDPEQFQARVGNLNAQPAVSSHDLLELTDGRVIERISLPMRIGETIIGRVWS